MRCRCRCWGFARAGSMIGWWRCKGSRRGKGFGLLGAGEGAWGGGEGRGERGRNSGVRIMLMVRCQGLGGGCWCSFMKVWFSRFERGGFQSSHFCQYDEGRPRNGSRMEN